MKIEIKRNKSIAGTTIGRLYIDGKFECYTLEDQVRPAGEKVYGKTAIPAGTYKVIINRSNRFKRNLPLLLNVPNFEGVRIHPGNSKENTEGCILPGLSVRADQQWVSNSRVAFERLFSKMLSAEQPIELTIG